MSVSASRGEGRRPNSAQGVNYGTALHLTPGNSSTMGCNSVSCAKANLLHIIWWKSAEASHTSVVIVFVSIPFKINLCSSGRISTRFWRAAVRISEHFEQGNLQGKTTAQRDNPMEENPSFGMVRRSHTFAFAPLIPRLSPCFCFLMQALPVTQFPSHETACVFEKWK